MIKKMINLKVRLPTKKMTKVVGEDPTSLDVVVALMTKKMINPKMPMPIKKAEVLVDF
jgi:hypothetical protein